MPSPVSDTSISNGPSGSLFWYQDHVPDQYQHGRFSTRLTCPVRTSKAHIVPGSRAHLVPEQGLSTNTAQFRFWNV
eukprot:3936299-Rhodomonas_salina.2